MSIKVEHKEKLKKLQPGPCEVTLQEIRDQDPCGDEWTAFLLDMNLSGAKAKDDVLIPLMDILNAGSSSMPGFERVIWIVERVERLSEVQHQLRGAFDDADFKTRIVGMILQSILDKQTKKEKRAPKKES
jgi:hypothetical protein